MDRTRGRLERAYPYLLAAPAILLVAAVQVYPTLYSLYLSVSRLSDGTLVFAGLRNYGLVLGSRDFWDSATVTLVYAVLFVGLTFGVAAALAILFNRPIRLRALYLTIIFVPWILSDITSGVIWRWMFLRDYGVAQEAIAPLIGGQTLLATPAGAMAVLTLANVWRTTAFALLLLLAALQTIPREVNEAASLDGAGLRAWFTKIVLPLIRPTAVVVFVFLCIQAINSLGMVMAITEGGPGASTQILSLLMYRQAIQFGNVGYGATIAVMMFFANLALALLYLRALRAPHPLGGRA